MWAKRSCLTVPPRPHAASWLSRGWFLWKPGEMSSVSEFLWEEEGASRFSFEGDGKVLKLDNCDVCTALRIY